MQKASTQTMIKNSICKGGTTSVPITEKGLNDIFENFQNLRKKNKTNDFLKYIDNKNKYEMTKVLVSQERMLKLHEENQKIHKKVYDYVKNKVKRKENEMLINTVYSFRNKMEINEILEKAKTFEQIYGDNAWVMGLRRPTEFVGARYAYINLRDSRNPYWQLVKMKSPEEQEFTKHPLSTGYDFHKNEYLMKTLSSIKMDMTTNNFNTNISVNIF